MNISPNSLKFIDMMMPWVPTIAKMTKPMATTTPNRMYLVVSSGGAFSVELLLYKIKLAY